MANRRRLVDAFIMIVIVAKVTAETGIIMLTPQDSVRRTDWDMGGGWAPPPMQPPKILLLKSQDGGEGDKKEDKLESLLPILMSVGPLILIAILLPVFMSLLSGIMGFVKSLLSMKMMPAMSMVPVTMVPNGGLLTADSMLNPIHNKNGFFAGRKQNLTGAYLNGFPSHMGGDMMVMRNLSSLKFPGI